MVSFKGIPSTSKSLKPPKGNTDLLLISKLLSSYISASGRVPTLFPLRIFANPAEQSGTHLVAMALVQSGMSSQKVHDHWHV